MNLSDFLPDPGSTADKVAGPILFGLGVLAVLFVMRRVSRAVSPEGRPQEKLGSIALPVTMRQFCKHQEVRLNIGMSSPEDQKRITLQVESLVADIRERLACTRETAFDVPFTLLPIDLRERCWDMLRPISVRKCE